MEVPRCSKPLNKSRMRTRTHTFLVLVSCLSPLVLGLGHPQVRVKNTVITGRPNPDLQQEFYGGIPFAEPPIRFAPPVLKLDPGVESLNATDYGPACPQSSSGSGADAALLNNTALSEDCLTLNIVRPGGSNVPRTGLPVMVRVYGGGYQNGASAWFPGDLIVAHSVQRGSPVIFVSMNYRLGPFGFPQGHEAATQGALNLGNKDVLASLLWIQENIGTFGGDKDKVTVFGNSAGAMILSQLLLDPEFNLARAAILESGSAASTQVFEGSTRNEAWNILVSAVPECTGASANDTFDCLRSASTESLVNASGSVYATYSFLAFAPVIDGPGEIIPSLPSEQYASGRVPRIPIITGTNLDEGTLFTSTTTNTTDEIRDFFYSDPDTLMDQIIELYPDDPAFGSPYGTGNETFGLSPVFKRAAAVTGDIIFDALRRELSRVASEEGTKVYSYLFSDPQVNSSPPHLGVYHSSETNYVFGRSPNGPEPEELSRTIIDYWISFASSLDPNDGLGNTSRPRWTEYTPSSQNILQLHSTNLTLVPDDYRKEQIDFLIGQAPNLAH